MKRFSENLWGTENPEKVSYAWIGEKCDTTINDFIEQGQAGILDFYLVTSFGDKLNPYKGWEEMEKKTLIWQIPEPQNLFYATHFPTGNYMAEITSDAIILEKEQSVFYFEKEDANSRDGIIGVPDEAYKVSNDAFVVIHNIKRITRRQTRAKIQPEKKEKPPKKEAQRKIKNDAAAKIVPTAAVGFKDPNKLKSHLPGTTTISPKTNAPLVAKTTKIIATTEFLKIQFSPNNKRILNSR